MLIKGQDLCARLPHAGRMCLLDELLSWDPEGLVCTAVSHRDPANPLRRNGRLAAVHAVEYAGQAAALHSVLTSPGGTAVRALLGAVNDLTLELPYLDDLPSALRVSVRRDLVMGHCAMYRFVLDCDDEPIVRGRLTVAAGGDAPWP